MCMHWSCGETCTSINQFGSYVQSLSDFVCKMLKDARIKWNSNHCWKVVFVIRILSCFPQPQQPQTWPKKFAWGLKKLTKRSLKQWSSCFFRIKNWLLTLLFSFLENLPFEAIIKAFHCSSCYLNDRMVLEFRKMHFPKKWYWGFGP